MTTMWFALAGCSPAHEPTLPVVIAQREVPFPSSVAPTGSHLARIQRHDCFGAWSGPVCIAAKRVDTVAGLTTKREFVSRNKAGDLLTGRSPFMLNDRRCATLPQDALLDNAWLVSDDASLIVAAEDGSAGRTWLSRDGCQTWERLPVERGVVGDALLINEHLILTAIVYQPALQFDVIRVSLRDGATTTVTLGNHSKIALSPAGLLGFGDGVQKYTPDGTPIGTGSHANLKVTAGCDDGAVIVQHSLDDAHCELEALGSDGTRWWRTSALACNGINTFSACTDTRLFIAIHDVVLEVTAEGLQPLETDRLTTQLTRAALAATGLQLVLEDDVGYLANLEWDDDTARWSWRGGSTTRAQLSELNLGEHRLTLEPDFVDYFDGSVWVEQAAGNRLSNQRTGEFIAGFPWLSQAGPRIPDFRSVNAPMPTLVFNRPCTVVSDGDVLRADACDPTRTIVNGDIVVDPLIPGRWISYRFGGRGEPLLVEDFGTNVTPLGGDALQVFGAEGEPFEIAVPPFLNGVVVMTDGTRRVGYVSTTRAEQADETRFVDFLGPIQTWRARMVAASGNQLLLQSSTSFLLTTFEKQAPQTPGN